MKKRKLSFRSTKTPAKVACTISAAALMLGVSQAATVGFNFQAHYCAAPSYSGAVVTAPAFGIGTNAWQSLPQMDTGYNCAPDYYTLDQVINTSTPTGSGLNPLPNGSIHVTWSGYTANVSGFAGYSRPGPHYTFGGNGYNPGNEQVYWGFIRDGVNFGPGSSAGDNNQPGYSIDITGLKSLFTNTPFAVQLIASADSMQYLTNAFVIDVTGNTTQSVVYPSTPPVSNVGDTAWVRGIGGGLSTASGSNNTDHLKIMGNRAAHGSGFNAASTIAGFIITDKPVITMPPNSVVVSPGDTAVWSGYAVGVPPLSYQWLKNGQPVSGATSTSFSLTNVTAANVASYQLLVTNQYGSALSAPVTVDTIVATPGNNFIPDTNPSGPPHDGVNLGATWAASSTDSANVTRSGVFSFAAATPGQIVVSGQTNLDTTSGSILFWIRTPGATNTGGHAVAMFDRLSNDGLFIGLNGDGTVLVKAGTASGSQVQSTANVADNKWHQVAVTYDAAGNVVLYVDGALESFSTLTWAWPVGQEIELGSSHDSSYQSFVGQLDDLRMYTRTLTDAEVASIHNTGATVDAAALAVWLTFDTAPVKGATLTWKCPDAILQSATSVNGTYTDVSGALSPYATAARPGQKYFRYRGHTPVTVISNPYMM